MHRSYDPSEMKRIVSQFPKEFIYDTETFDYSHWLSHSVMYVEGDSAGLCTKEKEGIYSVHWFFKHRGRQALDLAKEMLNDLFDNEGAEIVRGITPVDNKAARWAARQIGLKSYGVEGDKEILIMTKKEFKEFNHG